MNGWVAGISPHTDKSSGTQGDLDEADGEDDEEAGEDARVKTLRSPGCPTQEEMERHYLTHMPFRSWCPICIQGKGKENPHHRKSEKTTGEKPTAAMDYKSFGESIIQDDKRTAIVIRTMQLSPHMPMWLTARALATHMWSEELPKISITWDIPISF